MNLAPLLEAPLATRVHAFAAIAAFVIGLAQLLLVKGTRRHRVLGWIWAILMMAIAASSFFIHGIRLWGPWSPIHILSLLTLVMVPLAIWYARTGRINGHRKTMISVFFGALVVAGAFTFLPGRIMHAVAFGP